MLPGICLSRIFFNSNFVGSDLKSNAAQIFFFKCRSESPFSDAVLENFPNSPRNVEVNNPERNTKQVQGPLSIPGTARRDESIPDFDRHQTVQKRAENALQKRLDPQS